MVRRMTSLLAVGVALALGLTACSDDGDNGNGSVENTLEVAAASAAPTVDGVIDAVWSEATAFNVTAGASSAYQNAFGEVDVMLKAVTSGSKFYVLAQWSDPSTTPHDRRKEWSFSGGVWSKSGANEDRFYLMFDAGDNGSEKADCATMCHQPATGQMGTTGGGHVDVWHWKATRTNGAGFADDKWWDATGRGSDASIVSAFSENTQDDGSGGAMPMYMHSSGTAYTGAVLLVADTVALNDQLDWEGKTIPFYVSNPAASGSRWDVTAKGVYSNGTWTLEMCRSMTTDNPDDIVLGTGTVEATIAVTDNSGGNHSGSAPFDIKF